MPVRITINTNGINLMDWEDKIRAYLKANKIGQTEFAESFGESQGWLSHKLTGKRAATLEDLQKIASRMDMTVAELVSEKSYDPENPAPRVAEDKGNYKINSKTAKRIQAIENASEEFQAGLDRMLGIEE